MKSAVETLNPTRVRLTVEVPFEELKPSLDAAYRKINQQVQVPGFRRGKVPARVIDQRFGRGTVLEQAVNDALPQFYRDAVTEGELTTLGQPEVDITELRDNELLTFTAEVDVRPPIEIPEYSGIEVTVDAVEISDEDVDQAVERLRERFASTTVVEREAGEGDVVRIGLEARADGEQVTGLVPPNTTYTVGSGRLVEGLDEAVTGLAAGGTATFTTRIGGPEEPAEAAAEEAEGAEGAEGEAKEEAGEPQGQEVEITISVESVSSRELPDLDDDFAQLASEFDTLEELREDSRKRLSDQRKYDQANQVQEKVLAALLDMVEIPMPQKLLEDEVETRRHNLVHHQLGQIGMDLNAYLKMRGQSAEEFDAELREEAERGIRTQFVLEEIARREELNVSQQELTEHLVRRAQSAGMSPDDFVKAVVESNQVPMLVGEVSRGKALAAVVDAVTVTDSNGEPVRLDESEDEAGEADEAEPAAETGEEAEQADEAAAGAAEAESSDESDEAGR
ncbi:trigger factor [Streptomyces sp. 6N223]|uniref:trigger factor n=1 Tax=Streptomyces sp. 6N223 TaxID=3457412 RepID=UPI003FD136DE